MSSEVSDSVTPATSSSLMLTVAEDGEPVETRAGSVPNVRWSDSPSSSIRSSVVVTVNLCSRLPPAEKVTFSGTPLYSASPSPPRPVAVSGMCTVRSGSALSVTVTVTWFSKARVEKSSLSATL